MKGSENRKNFFKTLSLLLCLCLILCACTVPEHKPAPEEPESTQPLIGFAMDSLLNERWERDRDVFVSAAQELGAQVIVQTAYEDSEEQIKKIEYLIEKKVDVLVVIPTDSDALSEVLKKAHDKGIKIVAYDRLIQNAPLDLYISPDNVRVGEIMAEELVKKVPSGNYVILNGSRADNNVMLLKQGYDAVLSQHPDINIIEEYFVDNWWPEDAALFISKMLAHEQKIDAVLCGNDSIARAVIKVLAENRLADSVAVAAQDADLTACQSVAQGVQTATVYKNINLLAQKAAVFSVMLAKGEMPETDDEIDNQWGKIPFYKIEPQAVTKQTIMTTVVRDGFHRKEDVYADVPQKDWPE